MKFLATLAAVAAFATVFLWTRAGAATGVTYVGHDKVAESLAKGGPLMSAPDLNLTAQGAHRNAPGQVEVHDKETDVLYIVDGEATFVTGGTMIGGKQSKAGQWLGADIQGGETHQLTKGDVIMIPAGTPHWFKQVPGSVSYFVVKVLK
jgi:mannose-6-phosphate isomerase-like protein (cupin superfamily)